MTLRGGASRGHGRCCQRHGRSARPKSRDIPRSVARRGGVSRDTRESHEITKGVSRDTGGVSRDTGEVSRDTGEVSRDAGEVSRDTGEVSRDSEGVSRHAGGASRDTKRVSRSPSGWPACATARRVVMMLAWEYQVPRILDLLAGRCHVDRAVNDPRDSFGSEERSADSVIRVGNVLASL